MQMSSKWGIIQSKSVLPVGSINELILHRYQLYDRYISVHDWHCLHPLLEKTQYREVKKWYCNTLFSLNDIQPAIGNHERNKLKSNIYRPANWVRIGLQFIHRPYYGNMRDNWSKWHDWWTTFGTTTAYSPFRSFDYQLVTLQGNRKWAFIIGNFGLISGEYEYVNYSQSYFSSSEASYSDVNTQIKNSIKPREYTLWYRMENKKLRVRVGLVIMELLINQDRVLPNVCCLSWLGLPGSSFFVDIVINGRRQKKTIILWSDSDRPHWIPILPAG